jgi:hypothetical protein
MAAPNLATLTTITGSTTTTSLANTSETSVLSNAASSGSVYKINTIIVANDDGTNAADITISHNDAAAGAGTSTEIANTVTVQPDTSLVVLDKNSPLYLEENTSITATASAGGDLNVIISYEDIS